MAGIQWALVFAVLGVACANGVDSSAPLKSQVAPFATTAYEGQFPYVVSLQTQTYYEHFCAGSILNTRWILTSGHCVAHRQLTAFVVRTGTNNYRYNGNVYDISAATVYPQFNINSNQHDVAIVRTAQIISFSTLVQPIYISTAVLQQYAYVTIPSWSAQGLYLGAIITESLQYNSLLTIQTDTCLSQLTTAGYLPYVYTNNVCTQATYASSICRGSDGAPLVVNGALVGTVSYAKACDGRLPDVHTRIQPYALWIQQNTY